MRIHIVQKGDTLWKISKKYGVDFEELKAVNSQLSNPDMIMPGMKIKVPQGKKQVKKEAPKEMPKKEMPIKEMPKKEMPKKEAPVEEMPKQEAPPKKAAPVPKKAAPAPKKMAPAPKKTAPKKAAPVPKQEAPKAMPKPLPKIKEDEKMPKAKPIMEKPMMPMQMNMPIQMPMDENTNNFYTTFHLPQMPAPKQKMPVKPAQEQQKPQHKMPEYKMKAKEMEESSVQGMNQPMMNQPMHMPMYHHPYCPPILPQAYHYWDQSWCPPYHMPMGIQPNMNYPPQAMPYHQAPMSFEGDDSVSEDYMGGNSNDCGCGPGPMQRDQMMEYGDYPPNQMMAPQISGWYPHPMMNGDGQMRGYFIQPPQSFEAPQYPDWQDDEDDEE
ncbi:SafA/ExsA family spore coat assembly protein [Halobacillus sp. Marseille-Q1614]|uniref:SafA/ExsA family spore coat assembly protein n=1 Tax=Halobacillus sp. Marseille-Q1614 TaxID=2709134 RepID=UPI00156D707C